MEINVTTVNDPSAFGYLTSANFNPINDTYIQNNLNKFNDVLSDMGRNFMETSKQLYQVIDRSELVRKARAAVRTASSYLRPNEITQYNTLGEIRSATPIMQRYIMAQPDIRERYFEQTIDGYSDTYVDTEPKAIKDMHYDYCRVMNGVVQEDSEGCSFYKTYFDELKEGDRELYPEEKVDILNTWDIATMFLNQYKDPTDIKL